MWRMLRADLQYNADIVLSAAFVYALMLLFMSYFSSGDIFYTYFVNTAIAQVVVLLTIGGREDRGKRDRLVALLPVTPWQAGFSRLLLLFVAQAVLTAYWLVMAALNPLPAGQAAAYLILSLTCALPAAFILFLVISDLGLVRRRLQSAIYFLLMSALLSLLFLIYRPVIPAIPALGSGYAGGPLGAPPVAIAAMCLLLILVGVSLLVYARRESYLR